MRNLFISIILFGWIFSSLLTLYAETKRERFIYEDKGWRDPFVPIVTKSGKVLSGLSDVRVKRSVKTVSLEGIIFASEGGSLALIDGEPYRVGDKVEGFEVKKIQPERVILEVDGEEFVLELIKEEIK